MRVLRIETIAISEAEKKPFIRIKINISIISSSIKIEGPDQPLIIVWQNYRIRAAGRQWKSTDEINYAPLVMVTNRAHRQKCL
jgi:hypothetical protein